MAFRLPRLPPRPIPWSQQQLYWQRLVETLEKRDAEQTAILDQLLATTRSDAISASFTIPTLVATASDNGTDAKIVITTHTRQYGDTTSVSVTGATILAQPYSTTIAVYYDDVSRAGGAVTYHATTDLKTAQNNYIVGRHYVATVTTPASGGVATSGGTPPPGSGYGSSGAGGTVLP